MNLLNSVLNQTHRRAPKGIVYGPPGCGKSTFGAGADKSIIVDCENGAAHLACDRTPYLTDWGSIQDWLEFLVQGEHPYQTAVIDSIDWLLRRLEERVAGVNSAGKNMENTLNRSHGGFGNGKMVLRNYVYQYLLPLLDSLVNNGISVVLLAHAARRTMTAIDGITVEKSAPEIHPDLMNTMIEWSDFVGAAQIEGDIRTLMLTETNQVLAKNRYGIKRKIALSWDALMVAMNENEIPLVGEQNNG
jgi:hypothetical protein